MKKIIFLILAFTYSYAAIRYHIGKNIPLTEFFFIFNKAISWSAFTLISWSILPKSWFEKRKLERKYFGISGYFFAITHLCLNFILINENRFPKYYNSDYSWTIEFYIFSSVGFISLLIFTLIFLVSTNLIKTNAKEKIISFGFFTIIFCAIHPFFIGYLNWFGPNSWPFFMPPITLFSVLVLILFVLIKIQKR
jgi:DMSO/TMAO reductase YedYZ heme-binding membrane subunit